jgi:hypothetical protein
MELDHKFYIKIINFKFLFTGLKFHQTLNLALTVI